MNKLLAITSGLLVAGAANAEFTMPAFSVNSKVGFETAHVSEGRRSMDQNFAPSIEVGLPLFGAGDLYIGVDAYLMTKARKAELGYRNEFDPYVGFSYDITDMFTLDLGYTFKRYDSKGVIKRVGGKRFGLVEKVGDAYQFLTRTVGPDNKVVEGKVAMNKENFESNDAGVVKELVTKRHTHEIYAGVMADVLLNPSLYFSYDFTQRKANIEGALGYTFDLGSFGAHGLAIDLGAKLGYSRVTKPYGIKRDTKVMFGKLDDKGKATYDLEEKPSDLFAKKGWFYGALSADLVYNLNDNTKARAGVAFAFNNAKKNSWINDFNAKKHNVWFSSAIEFAF